MRLTPADLGRVRLVPRPHPVGAAVLASQALRGTAAPGPLRHLLPARGMLPDFVTPYQGLDSLEAGLDAIRATPRRRVRADVARAYAHLPATPWRRRLAAGDRDAVELLASALRAWFDKQLRPQWNDLELAHRRWVDRAAREWAVSGVDGVLGGIGPSVRWSSPVLEMESWWSADLAGSGEGLVLAPSPFAGPRPRLLVEPGRPALLVFAVAPPAAADTEALARLLGRTRAEVLRRLGEPGRHTTTALAKAAGISLPSASEHAAALRAAGLLSSEREGGAVVHRLTPLGVEVRRGG
ncbi:winged helix-turn-helix domain-containing protein [Phytohabitans houttuyneae]|uniref:Transcriptional regulator n=1 Tax=Phytohabitans houttuyneae TaxID=1076126 RepID=A0A6V8KPJ3_9ACTN|nr:transcriptional regulator [Phytohabitans houttuyneae]